MRQEVNVPPTEHLDESTGDTNPPVKIFPGGKENDFFVLKVNGYYLSRKVRLKRSS